MNTITSQWELFNALVIPKDAPDLQRREMRRAFFCGAESILRMQIELGKPEVSENAGIAIMEGWHDECHRFAAQVVKRDA